MNLLFVARTGVLEALTIGLGYLDQEDQLETNSAFGNIATEKKGELIYLGKGRNGNDVYCVGYKDPEIVVRINEEIKSLAEKLENPLKVIPVSVPGNHSIYTLSRLAMLPLVGNYFAPKAKAATLKIKDQLIKAGKNLQEKNSEVTPAAKPLKTEHGIEK